MGHCKNCGFYWVSAGETLKGSKWSDMIQLTLAEGREGSTRTDWRPPLQFRQEVMVARNSLLAGEVVRSGWFLDIFQK